ncbi:hypothetical protein FRC05_009942 [Tulasnella sp. 425]|nr:hypothetical protein FRC05_009942 [Tulasnella sp. 425]
MSTTSDLIVDVWLWSRDAATVKSMNEDHKNPKYLTEHVFPEWLKAVGPELPDKEFLKTMDMLLFAIPTPGLRTFLGGMNSLLDQDNLPLLAFVNKGIEAKTKALTLEIIADTLGPKAAQQASFISGPSFAKEGTDPIGVELAGALKNVYALAAGVADGLGYENNTRAGLVTRSLAEMTRIGQSYGASPLTFLTLAGVGDPAARDRPVVLLHSFSSEFDPQSVLVGMATLGDFLVPAVFLTCSSPNSRNYTVGYRLGQGQKLDDIIKTLGSVAEGVSTAEGLHEIIQEIGVEAPIAEAMYSVLYEGRSARDAAEELMNLPAAKREIEDCSETGHAAAILSKLRID